MNKQRVDDLMCAFRRVHNQLQTSNNTTTKGVPKKKEKRNITSEKYQKFLDKYHDLEARYTEFNTLDLTYFFREKAIEAGVKYVIANMKRDMGIFKRLQENFDIPEILLMIEFIFSGDQEYLDINRTQPTVLSSNWVNTIYKDSIDWANDEYVPREKKISTDKTSKREWKKSDNTEKYKIGEWD